MRTPAKKSNQQYSAPTVSERISAGRHARRQVARSALAGWAPTADRDPLALLAARAHTRIPELAPIRDERMAASPFAFFRGAVAVITADLASSPNTGLHVQLCGDAHLMNFGAFAAPDRRLVFSLNDFDETLPGPFEWDVKRLCASLAVVSRGRHLDPPHEETIVRTAAATYRAAMREFAEMGSMAVWYSRLDARQLISRWGPLADPEEVRALRRVVERAHSKDNRRAVARLTHLGDGRRRFVNRPPLVVRLVELIGGHDAQVAIRDVDALLGTYLSSLSPDHRVLVRRFHVADIARKVVGVGSVGTRDWVLLLIGRDDNDALLLQLKEAEPSVLEHHLGPSNCDNHGERVVHGQRLMQAASDVLLGWQRTAVLDGTLRDYYVRQLWDHKGAADLDVLSTHGLGLYGSFCAWTLARAHARSGDAIAISAYLGSSRNFDEAIVKFADRYATQTARDHDTFCRSLVTAAGSAR